MQLRTEKNISFLSGTLISGFISWGYYRTTASFRKNMFLCPYHLPSHETALVHPHHQGHGSHHHGCSTSCCSDWICFKFLRRNMRSPWNTVLEWSVVDRCQEDSSWEGNTEVINMYKVYAMCIDVTHHSEFLKHFTMSFQFVSPLVAWQPKTTLAKSRQVARSLRKCFQEWERNLSISLKLLMLHDFKTLNIMKQTSQCLDCSLRILSFKFS